DRHEVDVSAESRVELVQVAVDRSVGGHHRGQAEVGVDGGVERAGERVVVDDIQAGTGSEPLDGATSERGVHDLGERFAEPLGNGAWPERNETRFRSRLTDPDEGDI